MKAERIDKGPAAARWRRELEHGADPADPNRTVTRMRVTALYDRAWRAGRITDTEREAADKLAVLHDVAAGARDRPTVPTGRTPPWLQGHPAERQVAAVAELRLVELAAGRVAYGAAVAWVVADTPLARVGLSIRRGEAATAEIVKTALARMAQHWGME